MTKTTWGAWVIGAAFLLVSARARAEGEAQPGAFGSAHQVVVSAERLFGFVHASETQNLAGTDVTISTSSFSVLGNPLTIFSLFSTPHVAFDFFVAEHFSIGGTASYFRLSESDASQGMSASPTFTGFSFSPRLGASVALGTFVQFWPHLGFSLLHLTTDDNNAAANTSTTSLYALTIDAPFVFTVTPHFFLSVAPTMDLGLGGSSSSSSNSVLAPSSSQSAKETDLGVLVGLGGYL